MQIDSKPSDVQIFFDAYAADFDSIYGHNQNRGIALKFIDKLFRRTMLQRYQKTLKYTENAGIKRILDVGCGGGHYCYAFLRQGKEVVGIDMSSEMIKIAENKIRNAEIDQKAQLIYGDYLDMIFEEKFDAACLMGVFDYVNEPRKVLMKLKSEILKELYMTFPKNNGILSIQRKARYKLRKCPLYLYSKNDIARLLNEVGFEGRYVIKDCLRDYYVKVNLQ